MTNLNTHLSRGWTAWHRVHSNVKDLTVTFIFMCKRQEVLRARGRLCLSVALWIVDIHSENTVTVCQMEFFFVVLRSVVDNKCVPATEGSVSGAAVDLRLCRAQRHSSVNGEEAWKLCPRCWLRVPLNTLGFTAALHQSHKTPVKL